MLAGGVQKTSNVRLFKMLSILRGGIFQPIHKIGNFCPSPPCELAFLTSWMTGQSKQRPSAIAIFRPDWTQR